VRPATKRRLTVLALAVFVTATARSARSARPKGPRPMRVIAVVPLR
jgi:hypothetical protein